MFLFGLRCPEDGAVLLLIDRLIDTEGKQIEKLWETKCGKGLYPPPSLHVRFFSQIKTLNYFMYYSTPGLNRKFLHTLAENKAANLK